MIAAGFTSDDKVGIMMTLCFPCRCFSMCTSRYERIGFGFLTFDIEKKIRL